MADNNQPHPKNVPGPFYVLNGCCTACDLPRSEAPDLFTYELSHCYVKRQPGTKDEVDRMLRAASFADMECIRYRGNDAGVLRRFAEVGLPHLCDVPPPPGIRPVIRDRVTFDTDSPESARLSAFDLAQSFREYLLGLDRRREGLDAWFRYRVTQVVGDLASSSLTYSWFEDDFHTVEFQVMVGPVKRWLARHHSADRASGRGVSNQLDNWLRGAAFRHIRWYSAEQWTAGGPGQEVPQ